MKTKYKSAKLSSETLQAIWMASRSSITKSDKQYSRKRKHKNEQ